MRFMDDFEFYEERVRSSTGKKQAAVGLLIIAGVVGILWYLGYIKLPEIPIFSQQHSFLEYVPDSTCIFYWTSNPSLGEEVLKTVFQESPTVSGNVDEVLVLGFTPSFSRRLDTVSVLFTKNQLLDSGDIFIKRLKENVYVAAFSQDIISEYISLYSKHTGLKSEVRKLLSELSKRFSILVYAAPSNCNAYLKDIDVVVIGIQCDASCTLEMYLKGNETAIKEGFDIFVREFGEENVNISNYVGWYMVEIRNLSREKVSSMFRGIS